MTTRVYLVKETVMSGRGGYPSIGYRAALYDADTSTEVARTKSVDGVFEGGWKLAGVRLAKKRGWAVVPNPAKPNQ